MAIRVLTGYFTAPFFLYSGTRVPSIIRFPGRVRVGVFTAPTTLEDLFPTLLDLAGLDLLPRDHIDGRSLAPAITHVTANAATANAATANVTAAVGAGAGGSTPGPDPGFAAYMVGGSTEGYVTAALNGPYPC